MMPASRFADLPVKDVAWGDQVTNESAILGDPPDWDRYKKAHLWWDPDNAEAKAGFKLIVAKVIDGRLTVVRAQVSRAIAAINGARGGVKIPANEKKSAYDVAVRYLKKFDPDVEPPEFKGEVSAASVPMRGSSIQLQDDVEADKLVWQQVAEEGQFDGYKGGEISFTFDAILFQNLVDNFKKHPAYSGGETDVIPWDFHHASEQGAADGAIPLIGAPAQGWVRNLELRFSEDGKAQLWALTRWLEPARTFIKEGRYKWASVSVVFDAVDPHTGENVGAMLTSVALTNQPFIEGMQPLAASRDVAAAAANLRRYFDMYIDQAGGPEEAINTIRELLGMAETADAAAIAGELGKLRQWIENGTAPLGVDVEAIMSGLRRVLNLPALATHDEVFTELEKLAARLADESGVGEGGTVQPAPAPPAPPPPAPPAPTLTERYQMTIKLLAEKLGVVESEEAVLNAVTSLLDLRETFAGHVGCDASAGTKVILKAAQDNTTVREKYNAILPALGVEDPDNALDRIAELIQNAEELKKVAPELAALRKKAEVQEEEQVEADVEEVMNARGWDDAGLKVCLTAKRKESPKEFAELYPKSDNSRVDLTRPVVDQKAPPGGKVVTLDAYPGRNKTEKAIAFLEGTIKGASDWTWEEKCKRAGILLQTGDVAG